jgi:anti-anti-sigma regulatory factor
MLLSGETGVVVLNLAAVDACDAAGLSMLEGYDRAATAAGVQVRLAAPTPPVCRALRARGLMSRLRVFASVDGAARGDVLDLLSSMPAAGPAE